MKIQKTILVIILFFIPLSFWAQNGFDNPISKAMMRVYDQQLEEDQTDYETY